MKKEIKVEVPDNLTESEELALVLKKVRQKQLSGSGRDTEVKRIGNQVNIIEPETIIKIVRKSTQKPIEFCKCPVCESEYQSNLAVPYFTNYGGNIRKKLVCSHECVEILVAAFPGRIAAKKNQLKPIRLY